ncbi:MAG TPA: AAA family ATPase [Dehalococcoidia bacterium]|nr:AAA family ATPase [Dehalococcoidia bacterium]
MNCLKCGFVDQAEARFCKFCGTPLTGSEQPGSPFQLELTSTGRGYFGRHRELRELTTALEDVLAGNGRLVILAGEPGIGKTRTAQELAAFAEAQGAQVLWGRCYEGEGAPPFWPWIQSLRSYLECTSPEQLRADLGSGGPDIGELILELRERLPDLGRPPVLEPEQARFRLFNSIASFLRNSSRRNPLVFVLDDLHWADVPSLRLLEFLAPELVHLPVLVVGSYRDVEITGNHPLTRTLAELTRQPALVRLNLRGLNREEVELLVRDLAGNEPPQELVTMLHWQTEGNPLFVREVVRLLAQEGMFESRRIGQLQQWSFRLPEGIREVIGRRLDRLSGDGKQALTIASVIGREFDFQLLERLTLDLGPGRFLAALEEALQSHLVQEVPGENERYQFSHVLIRETLYQGLSARRQALTHAGIAEVLEELYQGDLESHAGELAHHFTAAEKVTGSDRLVAYSLKAGERALAAYAPEEALGFFQRALAAKEKQGMDAETAQLRFSLARAQASMAQHMDAWANLSRALDYYLAEGDAEHAVIVAEYPLFYVPGLVGPSQQVRRALELVPPDSSEAGRLLSRLGRLQNLERGDYQEAQKAFSQALAIARQGHDSMLEMRTLIDAADVEWHHLRWQGLRDRSLPAIELARLLNDPYAEVWPRFLAGFALTTMGEAHLARAHATTALALAEKLRNPDLLIRASHIGDIVFHALGDWPTAKELTDRGLTVAPDYPNLVGLRAVLEYELGNIDAGRTYIQRLLKAMGLAKPAANAEYVYTALVIPIVARITGINDNLDIAEGAASILLSQPSATLLYAVPSRIGLALIAVARKESRLAAEQYDVLKSIADTRFLLTVAMDRVLGLLAHTVGNLGKAREHFEDSLNFCRQAGYRPELAWTCYDYADCLLARPSTSSAPAEDRPRAMSLLDEALTVASELGMRSLLERVLTLKEQANLSRDPVASERITPTYPDGLTEREAAVLRLIALGKSNRAIAQELIISPSTVAHHVSNIFHKAGVSNRAQAATYAARHGLIALN